MSDNTSHLCSYQFIEGSHFSSLSVWWLFGIGTLGTQGKMERVLEMLDEISRKVHVNLLDWICKCLACGQELSSCWINEQAWGFNHTPKSLGILGPGSRGPYNVGVDREKESKENQLLLSTSHKQELPGNFAYILSIHSSHMLKELMMLISFHGWGNRFSEVKWSIKVTKLGKWQSCDWNPSQQWLWSLNSSHLITPPLYWTWLRITWKTKDWMDSNKSARHALDPVLNSGMGVWWTQGVCSREFSCGGRTQDNRKPKPRACGLPPEVW